MNNAPWDAVAAVAALRTPCATPQDAVRLHYLQALARRAQGFDGAVKDLLHATLRQALAHYPSAHSPASAPVPAQAHCPPPDRASTHARNAPHVPSPARPSALAELTRQLAQQPLSADTVPGARVTVLDGRPELKAVRDFRATWTQLSVDKQLTQALAQAPENAGPLNSHQLVLRALSVMRTVSPGYLNHFMSYVDALLWLDQVDSQPVVASAATGEAAKKRKAASRSKAR